MITIDTQILVYFFDPNCLENSNILSWIQNDKKKGIIYNENIVLNAIVPMEIAHNLFRVKNLSTNKIITNITNLISLNNVTIHEINREVIIASLEILKKIGNAGIGGRDSLILATMRMKNIKKIATHDKDILRIVDIERIDPVFNPPMVFKEGEEFDEINFKERIKELENKL